MDCSKGSAGAVAGLPEDPLVEILIRVPCQVRLPFQRLYRVQPSNKALGDRPPCGYCQPSTPNSSRNTLLAFDPAVSPHFHLIQFWKLAWDAYSSVHAYSSETGLWSHDQTDLDEQGQLEGWHHQGGPNQVSPQRAFVNGILHLIVLDMGQPQMVAVDVQGKTKKIMGMCWYPIPYIGQSQGRLHYINHDFDAHDFTRKQSYELFIWILGSVRQDFRIVAIHPDCNVVFFRQPFNRLIAYDMDRKEMRVVACLENENWYTNIAPYIPYFSESPALTDKH
ncbi:uncharacterized protein [Miscanthus floridulus]|uniref:uncharacterized protein n=1 Tax=Miscanthus floridulus TaxID=154761 RepID=UPI003457EEFC